MKQTVENNQAQMERVRNAFGIWINKGCMSCQHRRYQEGIRLCTLTGKEVEAHLVCPKWEMSDGMKKAGVNHGGQVRLLGTKEVIF
jgi:hypothetical protein